MDKLFNDPRSGTIIAHDIYGNKKSVPIKELKLRVSVYGILREANKVLLQRHAIHKIWGLPGGGVELGEMINDALIREFKEETGYEVKITKLLDVKEDFFIHEGFKAHSILIFYEVKKFYGNLIHKRDEKDSDAIDFFTKQDLKNIQAPEKILEVLGKYL